MSKKHSKHAKLTLRENGFFAPNEISFVGVKCGIITDLINELSSKLHKQAKIVYVDASHSKDAEAPVLDTYTFHASGNTVTTVDLKQNKFNNRILFSQYDLACINGNHYEGNKQVVLLDPEKESSVQKRIDQLGDVQFFIKTTEEAQVFSVLLEKYPEYKDLPVYNLSDIEAISSHIATIVSKQVSRLNGLVLAGGKSVRMGSDKGLLEYHGIPQRDHVIQLLEKAGLDTYLSVRVHQDVEEHKTITDAFVGLGPFGAICSAFMKNPNEAYLVLATDLPYVDEKLIELLISKRNPKKIATAIKGKSKQFVEPLITIWEPKAYPILLSYLSQGYSCPRKALINSDIEIVEVEDALIQNINTPEEFKLVKDTLK